MVHHRPAATRVTPSSATLKALKPLFLIHIRREGRHWVWTGRLSRSWPCLFARGRGWGVARALFVLHGGVMLNGQHLWKRCPVQSCVAPRCHSTEPPAWGSKRRAAETARKASITRRNAPVRTRSGPVMMECWA